MTQVLVFLIKVYKSTVSPIFDILFGKACRFTPTCSQYTIDALEKYGTVKGLILGFKRFGKCHPFGGSGYDPVQ